MLGGYRGITLATAAALIFCALIGWVLQPKRPDLTGDRSYQEEAAGYRAGGSNCQPTAIYALSGRKRARQADACAEAKEQHREAINQLAEARRSADAADAQAIASNSQSRIAAWGLALSIATLIAAIGAAKYARDAARHTKRAADAANAANAISAQNGQAQTRAYLSIANPILSFDEWGIAEVALEIVNSGQSPARNVGWRFELSLALLVGEWWPVGGRSTVTAAIGNLSAGGRIPVKLDTAVIINGDRKMGSIPQDCLQRFFEQTYMPKVTVVITATDVFDLLISETIDVFGKGSPSQPIQLTGIGHSVQEV
ncbi:hypothetical protein [Sphingomonas sp. MMS24-J13]|uniref:hypothetical protein n=1 Tax=Sphingomonas sp. MMS24-J13 TaxID=3238686 RepID=UPI00384B0443